jgi:hypothetical protein
LSVRNETRVIVEKGKEKGLAVPVRVFWVREIGTIHGIALPQIAKVKTLEAAIGLGTLLGTQSDGGGTPEGELTAQGAGSDVGFGDRVGVIQFKHVDDGSSGAMRLLTLEGFGPIQGFGGNGARLFPVGTGPGFETLKALQAIETFPASEGGDADGAARRVRNLVVASGDSFTQLLFATWRVLAAQ